MSQRDHRVSALAVGAAILLGAWGCGESREAGDQARGRGGQWAPPAKNAPNELLPVKALPVERPERSASIAGELPGEPDEAVSAFEVTATGEQTAADREAVKVAPDVAGWNSERLNDLASRQLQRLARPVGEIDFGALLADGFQTTVLVPQDLQFTEARAMVGSLRVMSGNEFPVGGDLPSELEKFRGRFSASTGPEIRFKPFRFEEGESEGAFATQAMVEIAGKPNGDGFVVQGNGVWRCQWKMPADAREDALPLLAAIEVLSYEQVGSLRGVLFEDATRSAFAGADSFEAQMMQGIGFWSERLTRIDDMSFTGHHGIAVADVNGDGLDDVYACDAGGLPNRLYLQRADGTVEDRSAAAGVDWLEDSRGALLVDLDNDGDQDLVVSTVALVLFAENDGTGKFTLKGGHQGAPSPFSMAAADYDNDGYVDIYVCSYGSGRDASTGAQGFEAKAPIPYNDANNGGRNILLANHGGFRFSDVTKAVGLDHNNSRWTFAAAWEDYDRDGDADLYVANDFGRNNLYRNDAGPEPGSRKFVDIAAEAGVEDMAGGMSVAWGDANGDGKMDIYVGNMFSAAGNRVTYQRKFSEGRKAADAPDMQRMARGNTLFEQLADGAFADVSESAGVTMGRWAWSSGFADINNDGREDIVIANGYLSNPKTDDL